ncbi:MAG: hypothetical protein WA862_00755 [Solirubrobacterales bacterium]
MRVVSSDSDDVVGHTREAGRDLAGEPVMPARRDRAPDRLVDRVREAQKHLRSAVRDPRSFSRGR